MPENRLQSRSGTETTSAGERPGDPRAARARAGIARGRRARRHATSAAKPGEPLAAEAQEPPGREHQRVRQAGAAGRVAVLGDPGERVPERRGAREAEVDVDVVERDRECPPACAEARHPERRARGAADERGRGEPEPRCSRAGSVTRADFTSAGESGMAPAEARATEAEIPTAGDPERDAALWAPVEEATELLQEGRLPEAMLALRDVIKAEPKNPYAYNYLGVAFFELQNLEAARDAYRAAVRLAPDYLGARVALSNVLRAAGRRRRRAPRGARGAAPLPQGRRGDARGGARASRPRATASEARQQLEGFLGQAPELEAQHEVKQILEMLGLGEEGEPLELDE